MIAIAKLIAAVVLGALGSIVGNEAHNGAPRIARQLIRLASKWYPDEERQDYLDEITEHMDCYTADGLNGRALMIGMSEWRRAALSRGLPSWIRSDNSDRLAARMVAAVASGVPIAMVTGAPLGMASGVLAGVLAGVGVGMAGGDEDVGVPLGVLLGAGGVLLGMPAGVDLGMDLGVLAGMGVGVSFFVAGLSMWFAPILGRALMVRIRHRLGPPSPKLQ